MATNIDKCVHLGELTYWRKTKKLLMMSSHSNHVTVRKRYISWDKGYGIIIHQIWTAGPVRDTNEVYFMSRLCNTNLWANDEVISVNSRDNNQTCNCCGHHIWTQRLTKNAYRAQAFLKDTHDVIMLKSCDFWDKTTTTLIQSKGYVQKTTTILTQSKGYVQKATTTLFQSKGYVQKT